MFILINYRLRATGVIDVENPAAQAMQMGSVEELPDSDEDDNETDKGKTK